MAKSKREASQIAAGSAVVVAAGHEDIRGSYGPNRSKYPYGEWFDGQTRIVFPSDLGVTPITLRNSLEKAALRRGGRIVTEPVRVRANRTAIKFRFESDEDEGWDDEDAVVETRGRASDSGVPRQSLGTSGSRLEGHAMTWPAVGYMG